jgi:pimeloyl-ACP methyl ester carboxylesterase
MPWTDGFANNDGARLAFRDYGGEGPAVLLLPGGGRNLCDWELVIPHLLGSHRVVAMDTRAHGMSEEPQGWAWDGVVADIESVIAEAGLQNPVVAGHSLGGMAAAHYGAAHPDCPGVVNVDGHGSGGPSVPENVKVWLAEQRATATRTIPPDSGDAEWLAKQLDQMRPLVEGLGVPWERAEPAIRRSYALESDGLYHRRPSNRFMKTLPPMGPDLHELYRTVDCPLLIFNCDAHRPGPVPEEIDKAYRGSLAADLDNVARERANVSIARMDNGHMVLLEDPPGLTGKLLAFMG